jgi:hypothetical protein
MANEEHLARLQQQTWPQPPLHSCGLKPTVLGPQVYDTWCDA